MIDLPVRYRGYRCAKAPQLRAAHAFVDECTQTAFGESAPYFSASALDNEFR